MSTSFLSLLRQRLASSGAEVVNLQKKELVAFLNPYSYLLMRDKSELLFKFDKVCVDGSVLKLFFNLFGVAKIERVSFDYTSIAQEVFERCIHDGRTLYVVGSTQNVIEGFVEHLKRTHPGLQLLGFRNGFFSDSADREVFLSGLVELKPDVVICGMGTPLQESFLVELREKGWRGAGYTCGGFLHQTAKAGVRYYPYLINLLGLRSIFRMYDEPKLVRRYMLDYPKFGMKFLSDYRNLRSAGKSTEQEV